MLHFNINDLVVRSLDFAFKIYSIWVSDPLDTWREFVSEQTSSAFRTKINIFLSKKYIFSWIKTSSCSLITSPVLQWRSLPASYEWMTCSFPKWSLLHFSWNLFLSRKQLHHGIMDHKKNKKRARILKILSGLYFPSQVKHVKERNSLRK